MMLDDFRAYLRRKAMVLFGNHERLFEVNDAASQEGSSRSVSTDYTELMGGSVPCPSCKGTGRIPKEMEETLVALIPLNDDRLKPKRTWFWVLIGIGICVLLASAAIFMLVPRAVELSGSRQPVDIIHVVFHNASDPKIQFHFMNHVNISNSNYYVVQVVNLTAQVISKFQPWNNDLIGTGANDSTVAIAPLSQKNNQLFFNNSVTLTGVVAEYCHAPFSRLTSLYVNMQFDVVVSLLYFNHREQISLSTTQQVCCVPSGNCTST
ncbi:unnamed protein product [Auanema sp. JU1783]|nr:unnamed protein product [Auanema sp. JU1783]